MIKLLLLAALLIPAILLAGALLGGVLMLGEKLLGPWWKRITADDPEPDKVAEAVPDWFHGGSAT